MAANVETMFSVRQAPWHGLGQVINDAPTSKDALIYAGLDWRVVQENVYNDKGILIPGYKVNIRDCDDTPLGIVSDRYKVVQNEEAFQFCDELLGEGVRFETAGSLQNGKRTWMLAKMPERYFMAGDEIEAYMVIMNSHDGSSGIKMAMTPIRVVCQNTLNLALNTAKRSWTSKHTENVLNRVQEARESLNLAHSYMTELGSKVFFLSTIRLSDHKADELFSTFFPVTEDMTANQKKNNLTMLEDLRMRYYDAPDLSHVEKNGWRFVNAVSDFATHAEPLRRTKNYNDNLFIKTVEGHQMIDKAYAMMQAVA